MDSINISSVKLLILDIILSAFTTSVPCLVKDKSFEENFPKYGSNIKSSLKTEVVLVYQLKKLKKNFL